MDNLSDKEKQLEQFKNNLSQLKSSLTKNVNEMFKESMPDQSSVEEYEKYLNKLKDGIQKEITAREIQNKIVDEVTKKERERIKELEDQILLEKKIKEKQSKQIDGINQLIEGNIKGAISSFTNSFAEGTKLFGIKLSAWGMALEKGIEIAERISKRQAQMNTNSIILGANASNMSFFNTRGLEDQAALTTTLGVYRYNQEQRNQIASDYARTYNTGKNRKQDFERIESIGALQKYLGVRGVETGAASSLAEGAFIREGVSTQQFNNQNFQQILQAQQQSGLSWNKFINV